MENPQPPTRGFYSRMKKEKTGVKILCLVLLPKLPVMHFLESELEHDTNNGYMAPEYLLEGKVSVKIDVFSFGVLLLEIISGRRRFSSSQGETDEGLLNYFWRLWGENKALEAVDQILVGTSEENEILRSIHIGLLCVQEDASSRPKMSKLLPCLKTARWHFHPLSTLLLLPGKAATFLWDPKRAQLGQGLVQSSVRLPSEALNDS